MLSESADIKSRQLEEPSMNRALILFAMLGWMFFGLSLMQDRSAPADTTTMKSGDTNDDGGIASPNCPADIAPAPNGDGLVNVQDLLAVIGAWGQCPGGCINAGQCDDGNPCTLDQCVAGQCVNTPIAGCCQDVMDCDDGNPCTLDICVAGACVHQPIAGCCQSAAECPVVPNASYVCVNNVCQFNGCSPNFADCDGDPMNGCEAFLNGDVNNCGGCGISADDNNPCTFDFCVAGVVVHQPVPANTPCNGGLCDGIGNCVPFQGE
jgi:hypothetical protein